MTHNSQPLSRFEKESLMALIITLRLFVITALDVDTDTNVSLQKHRTFPIPIRQNWKHVGLKAETRVPEGEVTEINNETELTVHIGYHIVAIF